MIDENKTDEFCEYSIDGECTCFGWGSPNDLNKCNGTENEQNQCATYVGY